MKTVDYFFVSTSPWTYLGHERFGRMVADAGAQMRVKPFDLAKVFPISGGLPLPKRAPQRQAYRLIELQRWADHLGVPINREPRHFPVDHAPSMQLIAAARIVAGDAAAFSLAGQVLRACWAEERDVSDPGELASMVAASGLDMAALEAQHERADAEIERFTQEAIDANVFGAPWYVVDGEPFWGQDRLDFVERALRRG
jgi:carboxymethylenebutenolidase